MTAEEYCLLHGKRRAGAEFLEVRYGMSIGRILALDDRSDVRSSLFCATN